MKFFKFILCLTFLFSINYSYSQVKSNSELYKQILKADSLLFEAGFNNCDLEALSMVTDSSLRFYHDTSGITSGKKEFIAGIERNICSIEYKPFRKLTPGTQHIYPLRKNGKIYGAIQKGNHEFYAIEEKKEAYLTSTAKFTNLWIKKNDRWNLQNVLSYNHQSAKNLGTNLDRDKESIEDLLSKNNVPALGIAKIRKGKVWQVSMYGNLYGEKQARLDAVFNVASLTKPIVTMLTLKLVENRDWKLDEPVDKYWTDPDVKTHPFRKILTTRHILTHQSGFDNWRWENKDNKLKFNYKPGEAYGYSGEGFEYLKNALESKFKIPLEKLADSLIFKPLKMNNTSFTWTSSIDDKNFARWHDAEGKNSYETHKNDTASAADNLLTTIPDYGRFAEYVLEKVTSGQELYQDMVKRANGKENKSIISLGWELLPNLKNDEYALLHTGGDIGVNTIIMLLPKTGEGIIIFTNGDNGNKLFFDLIERNLSLGIEINKTAQ